MKRLLTKFMNKYSWIIRDNEGSDIMASNLCWSTKEKAKQDFEEAKKAINSFSDNDEWEEE